MTISSQLSTPEPKKAKPKNELSKQLEQEQNHRNGDHMEGVTWSRYGKAENEGKGTGNKKHQLVGTK